MELQMLTEETQLRLNAMAKSAIPESEAESINFSNIDSDIGPLFKTKSNNPKTKIWAVTTGDEGGGITVQEESSDNNDDFQFLLNHIGHNFHSKSVK